VADASTQTSIDDRGLAHYVDLTKMDLTSGAGETVSLKNLFVDFSLHSSIFEFCMHGWVVVYDAVGLINRLPIVGEETLTVEYATPGNRPKAMSFRVWKVTDENPDDKARSSTYRLHFCSAEVFQDAFATVGKSYANTDDSSSILKSIVAEYLKSQKQFNTTSMKDPARKLVIPNYSPFDAIDMLLRRGYSGNPSKTDYYLFFERSDGFYLRMIDDLVAQPINLREQGQGVPNPGDPGTTPDTPVNDTPTYYAVASMKYHGDSVGEVGGLPPRDIRRVVTFRLHQRFDSLQKVREGLYENEVVQYSIMEKKLQSVVYKFQQKKVLLLGGSPGPVPGTTKGSGTEPMNTDRFMGEFDTPQSKFRGLHQSVRVALNQVQLSLTVPGDTMVDCGDVVYVEVPRFDSTGTSHEPDKFLCGKYVVGSVKDTILSPDKHVMTLDLFKDSFWTKVGAADFADKTEGTQS
jgi:hypothetical protein